MVSHLVRKPGSGAHRIYRVFVYSALMLLLLFSFSACSIPTGDDGSVTASAPAPESRGMVESSSVDFREESIYFLLPARFYDGDPSNNVPTEWSSYNPDNPNNEITDPQDVSWRGDFKGLIEHGLDYIQDLGFTAVWLTPVVHNRSPLDYHGYHAWDFNRVDPRLESPGYGYQEFIDAAHARGIKVIQDVVWNHSGRYGIKDVAELKYNTDPDGSWYAPPNPDWEYDGITPNPDDGKLWSRANLAPLPAPYNENLSLYNWPSTVSFVDTSDPDWFHHSGNGFAQGWDDTENLYNRALADDTPDLNTESQVVRDYLVDAYTRYIDMGVDAFRVDTVKHMARDSVLYFVDAFKAHDPDLFLFGEVAQKRHELHQVEEINPHWYTWDGAVGSSNNSGLAVLDFYAQATFHGVFEYGHSFNEVQAAARYDHLYSDPSSNVMWLDNHDFGPNNDWNRRFSGSAEDLAGYVNFTWTWRGIPSLYYGTEIQFKKGAYTDIHEAADINRSLDNTGRAYYGDNIFTASSHPLYQHIKKMNAIRKALPALQKGSWYWAGNPSNGNGVGYVRSQGPQTIAVGIAKGGSVSFNFDGLPAGTYRDAVTGAEVESGGSLSFNVEAGSAGIYVLNGPGLIGGLGAGFFQSSSNGQGGGSGDGGSDGPWDMAYFRGSANGWAADAMSKNADTGLWETTRTFGADNPRFKIDRYGDWSEAYPAQDYLVEEGAGEYLISFDDSDRSITLVKLGSGDDGSGDGDTGDGGDGSNSWTQAYFRGSANGWAADAMTVNPDTGLWETTRIFGADNPRFKIDRYGDWSEAYPSQDYLVEEGAGEYLISFDDADQSITLEKLSDGTDQNTGTGDLVVHFAEYESASEYILHSWDGLSGDFPMEYEGNINNRHWWSVSLQDIPDSFLFCFTNSNGNWDGDNRSFSAQGSEIYILPSDSTVYLSRP